MNRSKVVTLIVVLFTVLLAGVAVFTAVRLYQQRQVSVAPTAPTSIPRAADVTPPPPPAAASAACQTSFTLAAAPGCGGTCSADTDCPTDHKCSANKCVLSVCLDPGRTCDTNKCNLAPKCADACTTNTECPTDHTCSANKCVLSSCLVAGASCDSTKCNTTTVTPPPTTAAPVCGDSCTANSDCPTDHTCSANKCVLTTCLASGASCNSSKCSLVTEPSLPVAGETTPTLILGGVGIFAIIITLILAL